MRPRPRLDRTRRLSLALLLSAGLAVRPAAADVVRLKVGADRFGQGWMFLDTDGVCKVVTAGHVIRGVDGQIRQPLVLDGRGREWTTGEPILASVEPDIAVLPIPAAQEPTLCGDGRLSSIGVSRRVVNMADGLIRTTGDSEIRDVPVSRRASVIDRNNGALFAVRPKVPGDVVRKGWSGSVVLDGQGPLGIVFEVDPEGNEAFAVRVDVIRGLMANAPSTSSGTAGETRPRPTFATLAGTTLDPAAGPDQLNAGPGRFWQVAPKQHTVALLLRFPTPQQIRQVRLTSDSGPNGIDAVDVSTQAGAGVEGWTSANYCRAAAGNTTTCRFLQRTVIGVRILVKTRNNEPISLGSLAVE